MEVTMKACKPPYLYQTNPVTELASIVNTLCNPVYNPIAVAVSFLSAMLLIQALEIPSVDAE